MTDQPPADDRCDVCGGELKPGRTTLEIRRGEALIVIRDVPADVCQQCDEAYLSASVSERLDHLVYGYGYISPDKREGLLTH